MYNGAAEWLVSSDFLRGNEGDLCAPSGLRFCSSTLVTMDKEINLVVGCKDMELSA